ncbi:hypothetical protein BV25DRAFT_504199 [Artomyces pyxidatus]|uniref:Uncharacterized protein n=1 Tax=Artomyces pyxidatus TaxID=48021 RepID=A0ACB8THS0_9AGAM|nr:hypothetical protein BV25DRAFT_504199 [Artomyces pyxidatus]
MMHRQHARTHWAPIGHPLLLRNASPLLSQHRSLGLQLSNVIPYKPPNSPARHRPPAPPNDPPMSYDHPIPIAPSPSYTHPHMSSLSPFDFPSHTPSTIDTPVHDPQRPSPLIADDSHAFHYSYFPHQNQETPWHPSDLHIDQYPAAPFVPSPSKSTLYGALGKPEPRLPPHAHPMMGQWSICAHTCRHDAHSSWSAGQHPHPPWGYGDTPINHAQVQLQPAFHPPPHPPSYHHLANASSGFYPAQQPPQNHNTITKTTTATITVRSDSSTRSTITTTTVTTETPATYARHPPPPSHYRPDIISAPPVQQFPLYQQHPQPPPQQYVQPPAPVPPPVPLYQPRPIHPLPQWTKIPSPVLEGLFPLEGAVSDVVPAEHFAVAVGGKEHPWASPVAAATIEEVEEESEDDEDEDSEYGDVEMEGDEDEDEEEDELEDYAPFEHAFQAAPAFPEPQQHYSPQPAFPQPPLLSSTATGTLSPFALLCQPVSDSVRNQFAVPASQGSVGAYWN